MFIDRTTCMVLFDAFQFDRDICSEYFYYYLLKLYTIGNVIFYQVMRIAIMLCIMGQGNDKSGFRF